MVAMRPGASGRRGVNFVPNAPILIPAIAGDGTLHPIEKMAAHRLGILHQAVSVFVFSGDELLIQQRAAGKYHCGGQWANSCCSHPNWGESLEAAASRRLQEELGFSVSLTPANQFTYEAAVTDGLTEHEQVRIFRGEAVREDLLIEPEPLEVDAVRWAAPDLLRAEMRRKPESFAPWFRIYLERWNELGL